MKKYFRLSILALAVFSLSSCLKDDATTLDPSKSPAVVEFTNITDIISPQGAKYPLYVYSVDLGPTGVVPVTVNLTGAEAAESDVSVAVTPVAGTAVGTPIGDYNAEHNSAVVYEELPATYHDFTAKTVTIPKGSRSVTFGINLKPNLFDLSKSYALALKIVSTSVGGISSKFSTVIVSIGAKNKYDGAYNLKTTATTALQPNISKSCTMITTGPNSVKVSPGLLASYTNLVQYTVDPGTNLVTVFMDSLLPIATNPISKYDPVTKKFTLEWTSNGGARTFQETYTYLGPR